MIDMKKYNLIVLAGYTHWKVAVFATDMTYGNDGCYLFYDGNTVVACYPIEKTIITGIEKLEDE
jgi:hypothetical protein